ncbi:hypothetical protein ACH5RR_030711 [Cinchona calisaya]|uniref:Uncharacterized protein n=1 Tax=Cinchona calisaya TaxID=153742 RepID=A0ABD2YVE9_9GENT
MAIDTTQPSYWLNWRFLLCAIWILAGMVMAAIIIWRYEGFKKSKAQDRDSHKEKVGTLYEDEAWKTSSKRIHPAWLLAYRVIGFSLLLGILIGDSVHHSGRIFYFYTQWTFTLVIIYFGLASIFSIHGCLQYCSEVYGADFFNSDEEQGTYVAPTLGENGNELSIRRNSNPNGGSWARKSAGVGGYALQILFQTCAGAVMLTDIVFWLVLFPLDHRLNVFKVCLHSVNAVALLGDVTLNSLHFPFFRVAYFVLWTSMFVIFQWIIHACVSVQWPYPFLDLSSPYAPAWYLGVGLLTVPCFGIFALIIRIKKCFLSRAVAE